MKKLQIGIDYEIEDGVFEFTRDYLLRRGFCCNKRCKHCPFVEMAVEVKEVK
jgi:hypothetical protein